MRGDTDEFKRILLETNPVLLGVTGTVSMLHMVFDILAFKNDIEFWRFCVTCLSVVFCWSVTLMSESVWPQVPPPGEGSP